MPQARAPPPPTGPGRGRGRGRRRACVPCQPVGRTGGDVRDGTEPEWERFYYFLFNAKSFP
jgi:hypothetical protein